MKNEITLRANAKINLFLDITGRREDGYHTITGVMQAISLHDTVTVAVAEPTDGMRICTLGPRGRQAEEIILTCSNPEIPTDNRNLAWKAAEKFFTATGCGCRRLTIHIEKRIPAAAGLAGGSTNAAAVLMALNELFDRPLTDEGLRGVGVLLGADVPFCIAGGAQITEGIGEALTAVPPLPDCELVIACGGEGVSTPAAYKALDGLYGNFDPAVYTPHREELTALLAALREGSAEDAGRWVFNLFETAILPERPVARSIKETLLSAGAVTALMSGSGPSVFGIFRKGDGRAQIAKAALEARGIPTWVCEPSRE